MSRSAPSAEQGIALVKRERPDLVIMDVIMPGMNGFQATRDLSAATPRPRRIPILIITTKSMETDRVWGLRQGAKDFMTKPVREKDLLARINDLLPTDRMAIAADHSVATPFEVLADYERRSLAHVAGVPEQIEAPGLWRGIGFRVGIASLRQHHRRGQRNPDAAAADAGAGHATLAARRRQRARQSRADDRPSRFHRRRAQRADRVEPRAASCASTRGSVGLLIDEVLGQRSFSEEQRAEAVGEADERYHRFVGENLQLGDVLWGLFSMAALVRAAEFQQGSA